MAAVVFLPLAALLPSAALAQNVTLRIYTAQMSKPFQGVPTDPVAQEIQKKLGITMDITTPNAVGDINSQQALLIASNDLPDLTFFMSPDLYKKAITAKELLALDDLIVKYGQDILKNCPIMVPYSKNIAGTDIDGKVDGKLYLIIGQCGVLQYDAARMGQAMYVRWDLYKKLGYPKVDTLLDYVDLGKKMMALEPTNSAGQKTYGIGWGMADAPWQGDWIIWGMPTMYGWNYCDNWSMVSGTPNTDYPPFMTDTTSDFWKVVNFWNKAYRAGIVDPDSFTMKDANYQEKLRAARYLMTPGGGGLAVNAVFQQAGVTGKGFVQMPPLKDAKMALQTWNIAYGNSTWGWGIAKKSKYPEKAMQLLNYLASYDGMETIMNGVKGVHWDVVNGKPQLMKETIEGPKKDVDWQWNNGPSKYQTWQVLASMNIDPRYNTPINLYAMPNVLVDNLQPIEKEAAAYYKVTLPFDLYTTRFGGIKNLIQDTPEQAYMKKLSGDLLDESNKIDLYCFQNFSKLILPATDADFKAAQDDFIASLRSLGYEDIVKWYYTERKNGLAILNKK